MKKILAIILLGLGLKSFAQTPWQIDTTTPSVISGVTHYGDLFPVPWNKVNSNNVFFATWLTNLNTLVSNMNVQLNVQSNTLVLQSNLIVTLTASLNTVSNTAQTASVNLTNFVYQIGGETTNGYLAMGLDLTNRLDDIKQAGSSGSETVLKNNSPDGTVWYWHISDVGVTTQTGSP